MRWNCVHCGNAQELDGARSNYRSAYSLCKSCGKYSVLKNFKQFDHLPSQQQAPVYSKQSTVSAGKPVPVEWHQKKKLDWIVLKGGARRPVRLPPYPREVLARATSSRQLKIQFSGWFLRIAIFITFATTIGSGVYLYLEGRRFLNQKIHKNNATLDQFG